MGFMQKIRQALSNFMQGRYGFDQYSRFLMWTGVGLYLFAFVFALISGLYLQFLNTISIILYIYALVRIFSRNHEKRYQQNQKYLQISGSVRTQVSQFFVRMKNSREYKYFRCPQCHARLKMPRKVGEKTVTCGNCHHSFRQKA